MLCFPQEGEPELQAERMMSSEADSASFKDDKAADSETLKDTAPIIEGLKVQLIIDYNIYFINLIFLSLQELCMNTDYVTYGACFFLTNCCCLFTSSCTYSLNSGRGFCISRLA